MPALFLDLDHTLVDTDGADRTACEDVASHCLPGIANTDSIFRDFQAAIATTPFSPEPMPVMEWRRQLWHNALVKNGAPAHLAAQVCTHYYQQRLVHFRLITGVPDMLTSLRKRYKLALITNGPASIQRPKVDVCGIARFCDTLLISGEFGADKPDPTIFWEACNRLQTDPGDAIHVGDSLASDIQGASNARLRGSIWLRQNAERNPTDPAPTLTIDTILDLPEAADRLLPA